MCAIMKKRRLSLLTILLVTALVLVGCSSNTGGNEETETGEFKNVMFVVTGTLGGGTNNDDVYAALKAYTDGIGGSINTFEANMDTSLFETTLMQAAESNEYDLIVTGFGTMIEPLGNTAAKYPNQKFFIFDTAMDFTEGKNANVVSVQAYQNEGGFMAGVLAAETTLSDAEHANADKKVGFVGAIESTSILDFLMGYIDGVNYVDSEIEVLYSFVGNHTDSALAKEMALAQFQQGADVIFAVGGNGLGVAEAALAANGYAIGVDYDYAARLQTTSPETSEHVLTSVIKDYTGMVTPVLEAITDGSIQWGTHTYISYSEGGVYLVNDDNTKAIVSETILANFKEVEAQLQSGDIKVSTAFGATTEEVEAKKAEANSK